MDKFTPKTIDELNAEFEARIAKKREEQRAAELEKKRAQELEEQHRAEQERQRIAELEAQRQAEQEKQRAAEQQKRQVEEHEWTTESVNYASAFENAIITATEFETSTVYSGDDASADEKELAEPSPEPKKQENEYNEPDPHGYFGDPIDKSRPRSTLSDETAAKLEPKFDFERTSDYSGAMLQNGFKKKKKSHRGARAVCAVLIAVILVLSALTAAACVASANPGQFIAGRSVLVCEKGVPGTNIAPGSLCLVKQATEAAIDDVVVFEDGGFAFMATLDVTDVEICAIATHSIPFVGRFISSVMDMWIVYACCAAAAILLILIIRIAAFSSKEPNVTDGVHSKKSKR